MALHDIVIRGAREHNLRNLDLTLPRNKLIVMTGVSGSGKSSLAFDTLYAEGQRRYVESLSTYARQFLGQMPKPDVDSISGLAPSISIQQKATSRNPRSTVGTITEIYDYLRVLFARVGHGHCVKCQRPITAQSTDQILESIGALPEGTRFQILAPIVQQQKGEFRDLFTDLLKQGYLRARVDGEVVSLSDDLKLRRHHKHTIEVVIDRLVAGPGLRSRLAEAVEGALRLSSGTLLVVVDTKDEASARPQSGRNRGAAKSDDSSERLYSANYSCPHCGIGYDPPSPQLFSFNSPLGMCTDCTGLGSRHEFLLDRLLADDSLSIAKGCFDLLGPLRKVGRWRRHIFAGVARAIEQDCDLEEGAFLNTPWSELPAEARKLFLNGMGNRHITFAWRHSGGVWKHGGTWDGYLPDLLDDYLKARNPMRRRQLEKYMETVVCSSCQGTRLNPQARNVTIRCRDESANNKPSRRRKSATRELSLPEVCTLPVNEALRCLEAVELDETELLIATEALKEIRGRIGFLLRCGLDYLSLDRTAPTLSGGESQRIRLAGQIGCGLVGVVYILDEPSIGLHPRDNAMLLDSLCDLRDQGNTVIVVEHDEETMRAADHIVDFGPGPGVRGGEIVAEGSYRTIVKEPRSVTGAFLTGRRSIEVPQERRSDDAGAIVIRAAQHNNLREIDVEFPLGRFVCVTGVSGSGKSSLVNDILWQVLHRDVNEGKATPGRHASVEGLDLVDKAIDIDQSPIGRTPRSNPATYVKLLDEIRKLYTQLPQAKVRGYKAGRFSFNVAGGRCEACEGHGATKLEMDFLADIWVQCVVCEGKRFNHETLEVRYRDRNIAEVLDMDVQEALEHFANQPRIHRLLQTLHDVGLDYMKLGQPSPTLSGGEAQRIKLARELGKRSTGQTVYLLDEPTTGLHFADVEKLLEVLHGFVDEGNTVIVVEHNLDVIKTADWIIDLGPEGGVDGGRIVAAGTPERIAEVAESHTGRALRESLKPSRAKSNGVKKKSVAGKAAASAEMITIRGAAQHNLQHIDASMPRNRINVFCGPSGSGKSSLAMDTLYAEGQRRYVESLSAYARQFLGQMPKPRVDHIDGLSPAIAIEQKTVGNTPRSTVGTVTEIYDYLRVLFARLGQPHCPDCGGRVIRQTTDQIVDRVMSHAEGTRLIVAAPVEPPPGQSFEQLWQRIASQGFLRVRIDGTTHLVEEVPAIDGKRQHLVEVVVDRIQVDGKSRGRIADSIEAALELGRGGLHLIQPTKDAEEPDWAVERHSLHASCPNCDSQRAFVELTPQHFSFNSPLGWCPACEGLGTEQGTNLTALVPNPNLSINEGAVAAWADPDNPHFRAILEGLDSEFHLPLDTPFYELDPRDQRLILYGSGEHRIPVKFPGQDGGGRVWVQYKGLYPAINEASRISFTARRRLLELVGETSCSVCGADRIREDAAAVRLRDMTLPQLCRLPLDEALSRLKGMRLSKVEREIASDLLQEVLHRLTFLVDVGLGYLTLDRTMPTLSGGESQRIRLAGQIGRALTGVLYVLDEPTIGLHPRDNQRLIGALTKLRDLGNTLVLVEHDREVLDAADHLYDFGPGAGRFGGTIVSDGTPKQLRRKAKTSLTGAYLSGSLSIPVPPTRRITPIDDAATNGDANPIGEYETPPGGAWLELTGARQHNLRGGTLRVPLGTLTCVTGVSGSGKSSLIEDTLARAVARQLQRTTEAPGAFEELRGVEYLNQLVTVDQKPLGATPASNPATYTGVFDLIRELFTRVPDSRVRGYRPGRFSFNRAGGRCEDCEGLGQKKIEMHFLPDVWVECTTCRGQRYNQETLAVKYRGHSIADVLELPIGSALKLFENIPAIRVHLATLCAIGLDYLTLGQSAPTLSGGEAQRVKLAAELARPSHGKTLYLLDEPTTGLHFDDIAKLLKVLNSLVEQGNTVVVIEHNLDVIKTADWIVDLGPEAGVGGGWIVAAGTPEQIVEHAKAFSAGANGTVRHRSWTGELLAPILRDEQRGELEVFDPVDSARTQSGDLEMKQVGKDAALPWQADGRKWHTRDRLSHQGQPCRWEGSALEFVIDTLAQSKDLAEANWNHRSIVEVLAKEKSGGWFLHAQTGDEWLLTLKFRVKKGTFQNDELVQRLNLTEIDDLDDLPVYGRSNRVRAKNLKGPWQEVTITVHWRSEVDTPEFREFLTEANDAYLAQALIGDLDKSELTPWKVLGRKWHLSRKGFPSQKRVSWDAALLEELFDLLDELSKDAAVDWSNKQVVNYARQGVAEPWATVHTKRRQGVDLTLLAEPGRFALGRIAQLGSERDIGTHRDGRAAIKIRLDGVEQVRAAGLRELLVEHLAALSGVDD